MLQSTPTPPAAPTTEAQGRSLVVVVPAGTNQHILDTLDSLTPSSIEQ
jgi:hypothetical protein